jgi:hypothetical protein
MLSLVRINLLFSPEARLAPGSTVLQVNSFHVEQLNWAKQSLYEKTEKSVAKPEAKTEDHSNPIKIT